MTHYLIHMRALGGLPFLSRRLLLGCLCLSLGAPASLWAQSLQDSGLELPGVWAGQAKWGDYDDDGDVDLALIGETLEDSLCVRTARIFRNDSGLLVEDVAQAERLSGVYFGDLGWADYDSDGDLDLGIVGWDSDDVESLSLYLNEPGDTPGELLLTFDIEQTDNVGESVFSGVRYAAMSWVDYDNDGDLDLVVSGMESNGTSLTRVYTNDDGRFQADELNSESLVNVHHGDLAWADYDSDGDLDLALSGETVFAEGEIQRVTEFYTNDPIGSLNLDQDVRVESAVKGGSLAWADYDTDGNPDLAVSGRDIFWISVLQLYKNRPAGVLSLDGNFNLNVFSTLDGALDWIDYDNDGFLELAVSGRTILSDHVASVFSNNEGTVTSASVEQTLEGLAGGLNVWGDYDGDGRADLMLGGVDDTGERRTILYGNLGTPEANRTPDPPQNLQAVEITSSQARFSWVPGEDVESATLSYAIRVGTESGLGDIVSSATALGPGSAGSKTSFILHRFLPPDTYFWNVRSIDGGLAASEFSPEGQFVVGRFVSSDQVLRSMDESAMTWGDVDGDGDDDLAIMGKNRSGEAQSLVYFNRDGVLTQDLNANLQPLRNGDVAWGDYDNDGDLDLMSTGEDSNGNRANILYRTDLSGSPDEAEFVSALRFQPDLSNSSVDWGDVDNDGDLDLLLMGQSKDSEGGVQLSYTQLWVNDGAGNFATSTSAELVGLNNGEALFGDVDGDGDLDVMTTGVDSQGNLQAKLYRNLLPDELRDMGLSIPGMQSSDITLGDFDRDGDLDLAAAGLTVSGLTTAIYTNDGVGGFEQLAGVDLPGIQGGDVAWADFDNDQDLDLVVAGNTGGLNKTLQLYENTIGRTAPDAPFILVDLPVLRGVDFSSVSMADVDGDGDLDLISAGKDSDASQSTAVNDNLAAQQLIVNRPPGAPADLVATDVADLVTLSWQAGSDDADPPVESLTYNARVGTAPEGNDVLSGAIALGPGNIGARLTRELSGLTSGTYYWSVQTVDVGASRSTWSDGNPFIIDTVNPTLDGFLLGKTHAGLGQTVTLGLSFLDEHSGVNSEVAPVVQAEIDGTPFPLSQLLFSGRTWSGELVVTADMPSGEVALSVSGLVDLKGNTLADTTFSSFVVDTDLPVIVDRLPSEDATGVSQSTSEITIGFSETVDPATVTAENFSVLRANVAVPLRVEQPADTSATVTLIFEEALRPGSLYNVEVSAAIQDLAANRPADAISWSFETQIPQLATTVPVDASVDVGLDDGRLRATFDAGLDLSVLNGAIEVLREEQAVELRDDAVFDTDTNTLSFEIDEGLLPGSRYRVVLSGLLAGPLGAISQGDFDWRFTTAVPQISSLTPADGDTTVSVEDDLIRAIFDQRLDPMAALTDGNIQVTEQGSQIETDDVEYNADTGSLSFSLEDGLSAGTRYTVTIDGSVGGPLRQETGDYAWSFSTAVPLLTQTAPQVGEIVSTADLTAATVQFSVPLDDEQVNPANFILLRESSAVSLREGDPVVLGPGLYGVAEADGWKVGSSYTIRVATTVQGPLGPGQVLESQFQTTVPDMISVSPAAGDDDVNVNISGITALFDDLIDEDALRAEGNVVIAREGRPIEITDPIGYDRASGEVTIPVGDLRAGSSYQVHLDADIAGPQASEEFRWGFSTLIPTLSSTSPPGGSSIAAGPRRIQLVFSSDVDEELARNPRNYRLTSGGESIELAGSEFLYEADTFTVSLPEIEFLSGTGYDVLISSRLGGPRARRPDDEFSFSTDLPTIDRTEPDAGSEGVATTTATILLRFSGPVARQDTAGFQLRARSLAEALSDPDTPFQLLTIAGFGLDPSSSEVNFAPLGGFAAFTEYEIIVEPSVFGQRAVDGFTLRFSTAARVGNSAEGGSISNADRSVELYFPPNAIAGGQDGEVVIRPLEATDAGKVIAAKSTQATLTQVGQTWQIDGLGASLMKPATLTMRYTGAELDGRNATRLGIFRLDGTDWVRIGGTTDPSEAQVQTTIDDFAVYALFEDLSSQVGALAIAAIDVQPQAFAPAGGRGNMRQETDISFDLSGPADVTVRVYSTSGRLERVVARDTPMGQGRNSLVWDGLDEDRKTVGSGLYIVVVSAGDEQAEKVVAVVR